MSGFYLDGGGSREREAFLSRIHGESGFAGPLEEYRARTEALDEHPYVARAIRDLVLRNRMDAAIAHLRLTAVSSLHLDREIWIGRISRLVALEEQGAESDLAGIVEKTLALLIDENVDGAMIFSSGHPRYLRDLGFECVGGEGIDVDLDALAGPTAPGVTVRTLTLSDASDVRRIHQWSGAGEPLWLLRDAERWDYLLRAATVLSPQRDPASLVQLFCVKDGRPVGYAIAAPRGPVLDLLDLGLEEPDDALLATLLDSMRAAGGLQGCARMRAPVPAGAVGRLLRGRFRPTPLRDGLLLVASLGERLDLSIVLEQCGGYAGLDRS